MPSVNYSPVLGSLQRFSVCSWHSTLTLLAVSQLRVVSTSEWSAARLCSGSRFVSGPDGLAHEHTTHRDMVGTTKLGSIRSHSLIFILLMTLPFLLRCSVLVLALEVMDTEAQPLGMYINWTKTKFQDLGGCDAPCQRVSVQGNEMEVVESFVYLGSLIHCSGAQVTASWKSSNVPLLSASPCLLCIRISGVPQSRWKPSSSCIMLVSYQYSCMDVRYGLYPLHHRRRLTCLITVASGKFFIFTGRILSQMKRFGLTLDNHSSDTIHGRRLSFFRHLSRADPSQDHSRALQSCILGPPKTGVAEFADRDNLG